MPILPRYQLYYSLRSPFARRVRVALQRLSISYEGIEENVFEPTPGFLKANPLALLPVLVVRPKPTDESQTFSLPDSSTILEYLHETYGERIWPSDRALRAKVRAASTFAEGLMTETVRWYLESQRPVTPESEEARHEAISNLDRTLSWISSSSLKSAPWKVSDLQMTQAGYDLVVALEYMRLRLKGFDWESKYPALQGFLDSHRIRQDLAVTAPPAV